MLESKNRTGRRQTKGITMLNDVNVYTCHKSTARSERKRNRKTSASRPPNKQIPETGFEKV